MALTTQSVNKVDKDRTPEYYTAIDSEGKGYLAKRELVEEVKVEELVKEEPVEIKPKKRKNKK